MKRWIERPLRRWRVVLVLVATMAVPIGGCAASSDDSEPGEGARWPNEPAVNGPVVGRGVDRAVVADISARNLPNGRFRLVSEVGAVGFGVVETVVDGEFDEHNDGFEARVDLARQIETAPPGLLADLPPMSDELVIRGAAGLVFMKVDEQGWILLPGSLDELLSSAGVTRPDALLDLLDWAADGVVEVPGGVIDGDETVRYSGWLPGTALASMPGNDTVKALESRVASMGNSPPWDLLDRMVRFDVWVDGEGQARRLVIELDLDTLSELSIQVDGHDEGIDRIRLRHQVDWFDLGSVMIEPPPRSEVSVIDYEALHDQRPGSTGHGFWE